MNLLIDNYDSFSYNLYQLIGCIDPDIELIRNDACTVEEIAALAPEHIIISPGPGYPVDAGICIETVRRLGANIPILGVCLGHQAICEAYGACIDHATQLMHGKQSEIEIDHGCPLFAGLPRRILAARYHSLAVQKPTLPDCLRTTAHSDDGEVMAVMHREFPVFGVQFHPESILTLDGHRILENFLKGEDR